MSVTVTVTPLAQHAAFNPVDYTATSDRSGSTAYAALTPTNAGGFVIFTQAGHVYEVDDVLTLSGFADSGLNTDVAVTAIAATPDTFTTNLVWDAIFTGDSGTVTMNNQNLIIQVSILKAATVRAVKDVKDFSGFNFDLSNILQGLVLYNEIDLAGARVQSPAYAGGTLNSSVVYTLSLQDKWTDIFGNNYSDTAVTLTTISGSPIEAFNMALNGAEVIADYIMSTGVAAKDFLTNNKTLWIHEDETYQLHFITSDAAIKLRYRLYTTAGGSYAETIGGAVTINNNRGMVLIDSTLFTTAYEQIDIAIVDTATSTPISETIVFYQKTKCVNGVRAEWLNLLGGFDAYTFPEYEDLQQGKVQNYQGDSWKTAQVMNTQKTKMIGEFSSPTLLSWLSEILTSRKITKDGDNAVIVNESLVTDSRNYKKPILTIQTDDKITN